MNRRWYELLMEDHTQIERVFAAMEKAFQEDAGPSPELVEETVEFLTVYVENCHNKKEENHLFPLIQERGVPARGGPLGVMLAEHEQQTAFMAQIVEHGRAFAGGDASALAPFRQVFGAYAALCKDHYWKENDILYPMAIKVMSANDEQTVMQGIEAVEAAVGEYTREKYYGIAEKLASGGKLEDLSIGLDREVLACILNTLPVEISFVDADDTVRYFSHEEHDKIFPRSRSAIGTKVQDCHPAKSVHLVNRILSDFKAGQREVAEFWIDFREKFVHIRYFPVHGKDGEYLGSLEVVQDVKPIRDLEGERRLLAEE